MGQPRIRDRVTSWFARVEPPRWFGVFALVLVVATLVLTSITESRFIGQSIIDRESGLVGDMVGALAARDLTGDDLDNFSAPESKARLERSFGVLRQLTGAVRIKVFRRDETIVWSDEPRLVGTSFTMHRDHLAQALAGETHAVFDPPERALLNLNEDLPRAQLVEFYVPIYLGGPHGIETMPRGVLALYRLPEDLNTTIRHALAILWIVTGLGGVVLYVSLIKLVQTLYGRQRKAELEYAALSEEHQRVVHVEKLSAVGQTVGEIAHQINNPLVGVVNLAELAQRESDVPPRVQELLGEIRRAGEHCRGFVQRMLGFSQIARYQPQRTDVGSLVRDVEQLVCQSRPTAAEHLTVRLPASDAAFDMDPVLVRHALFNLVQNALQACPDGQVEVSVDVQDDTCDLVVSDNGPGIAPGVANKMFAPFYTTRPGGTGLGLPVVKLVAIWHGGEIRAENRPEGGARFILSLPIHSADG